MVVGNRHKVRCLQFISIAAYGEIGVVEQIGIVLTHKHYLIAYGAAGIVECAQRAGMVQWLDVGKEIDVIHRHQAVDGEARYHVEAHCLVGCIAEYHPSLACAHHDFYIYQCAITHTGALIGNRVPTHVFTYAKCSKHIDVLFTLFVEFLPCAVAVLIFERKFVVRVAIFYLALDARHYLGLEVDILGIGKHGDALRQFYCHFGLGLVIVVALIVGT